MINFTHETQLILNRPIWGMANITQSYKNTFWCWLYLQLGWFYLSHILNIALHPHLVGVNIRYSPKPKPWTHNRFNMLCAPCGGIKMC